MPKIVWGPFIGQYAADGTDVYAQGTLPVGTSTIYPASMPGQVSPLTAARSPVLQEISVGMSGEEAAGHTVTGVPPLSLPDSLGSQLLSWSVDLSPYQDLHGYANPWPAGGGKNLLDCTVRTSFDVTAEKLDNGKYYIHGMATGTSYPVDFNQITLSAGTYTFSVVGDTSNINIVYTKNGSWAGNIMPNATFTLTESASIGGYVYISNGTTIDTTIGIQLESGSTVTDWTPYSNICPISGTDKLNLFVKETYDPGATPKAVINLPQTVYSGTVGSDGGEATWGNIASYNGETLPGEWISSMDVYAAGTTPTIGAQVVYELATPTTFAVPSVTIPTPRGTASAWATAEYGNVDSMSVTYVGKA